MRKTKIESAGTFPRVTLGVAAYSHPDYLAEAIRSGLDQDYEDFELLIVDDCSPDPRVGEILASFEDPRLRIVRHPENRGMPEAFNTMVIEARGELIAMLGDDDVCLPDRLSREVAIFDSHPDTGVVYGDALIIDGAGQVTGEWRRAEFTPSELMHCFIRRHNYLIDPTRMVHRRVYDAVGLYDPTYPLAQDLHFWLRAARRFRFRHCAGAPLICYRRHGNNSLEESNRDAETEAVERAVGEAIEASTLRELVPELDWSVLDPRDGERQALLRLADHLDARELPLPGLAEQMRERAAAVPVREHRTSAQRPRGRRQRVMITSFGWNDSGGGTTVPRLTAKELARRGWEVTVFHAATALTETRLPYEVLESEEDGVHLISVHNRPHGIWDLGNPLRELDDPPITFAFAEALDRFRPDLVHFHNLHNLGAALMDQAASRGLPAFFSTHNYWLICPRAYLMRGSGATCAGPGDGQRCAQCVGSSDRASHHLRLEGIRARASRSLTACLTVSHSVRQTLISAGYPPELLDVVRQAMPQDSEIWERLGRDRAPGRAAAEHLTVGFLGSAFPHKGPQLLVRAAQKTDAQLRVRIHGEISDAFAAELRRLDRRGVVELCGAFASSEIDRVLAGLDVAALPSTWWDCAPLAAAECRAACLPLLAPRLGGLGETVVDGVDGLLFDALDPEDLGRCLDRLAGEPGLLERLQAGIAAPRDFSAYVDDLEAYYDGQRPGRVELADETDGRALGVCWKGDHGVPSSLSIINDRVCERLAIGSPPMRIQRVDVAGTARDAPLPSGADVEVRHQWPPDLGAPTAARLAVIQPWEFGAIPREWIGAIRRNVDALWVPSDYVRQMYLDGGLDPSRVLTVPNGVDLERFTPAGPCYQLAWKGRRGKSKLSGIDPEALDGATKFLFVGGLVNRKGPDILFDAFKRAFAGREDVLLVVKTSGAKGVYREDERDPIAAHASSGALPRVLLVEESLSEDEMASLYRACDVLVHSYRGEGFAMPVLEAMACGLPPIVTAGGPTDEFCPPEASWRIRSERSLWQAERVAHLETTGQPWLLEPDAGHLAELLRAVAGDFEEISRRGRAARAAAERLGWDHVAELYAERIAALRARPRFEAIEPAALEEDVALGVLATPAWRGEDRLGELLAEWAASSDPTTSACLYLLADPQVDGSPEEIEARVLSTGVDLEAAADVTVLMQPVNGVRDRALHAAVDAYVPLHGGSEGHLRMARAAGNAVLALGVEEIGRLLAERAGVAQAAA